MSDKRKWNGSKWCRRERRLAIYLRDGLSCVYCGIGLEEGVTLSLDHLTPHSQGGSNKSSNLVTSCRRCNSVRGNRPWKLFTLAVSQYTGNNPTKITQYINRTRNRKVDINYAKTLIEARGSINLLDKEEEEGLNES
jgi:5-methylcytosine-specific restriction endonuclease McrA